jgi:hypothetical protein
MVFSPGIKLGYNFSAHGGFTYGIELSYVNLVEGGVFTPLGLLSYGPVLNIDRFNKITRIHLGIEAASLIGVCVGPTLVINDNKFTWGYSVIPFVGLFVYLYYNYTYVEGKRFEEIGTYLKCPILPRGFINL